MDSTADGGLPTKLHCCVRAWQDMVMHARGHMEHMERMQPSTLAISCGVCAWSAAPMFEQH
eukprot:361365-Chlamydomonas_euryale.AAC.13